MPLLQHPASHLLAPAPGIYIGDNKFIHSPRTGASVRVEDIRVGYWRRFDGARRAPRQRRNGAGLRHRRALILSYLSSVYELPMTFP